MQNIAIYGAGGFGKETRLLLEAVNRQSRRFDFHGFLDDALTATVQRAQAGNYDAMAIAIAAPSSRRAVYGKCGSRFSYPNLIHPDVFVDSTVNVGKGLIVCSGVKITVDVTLGDFVIVNLNATIGHDVRIGAFSSIMPSANISGNVTVGEEVFIGAGATVLQGLRVGDGAVIGAGAVVARDVPPGVVAKGVPARWA